METKKLRIKQRFADKNSGKIYIAGEVVEFETKRADELLKTASNLVEDIESAKPEKPKK